MARSVSEPTDEGTALDVRRRSTWFIASSAILILGAVSLAIWHSQHPEALPIEARTIEASTPVGEPIYIGIAPGIADRMLTLSGVKVHTTSNTDLSVTPLLCRAGRIEATTDPNAFCADLVNPENQRFTPEDSIVLRVVGDAPAIAVIDHVELGFRENLQWGTFATGAEAIVRVLSR